MKAFLAVTVAAAALALGAPAVAGPEGGHGGGLFERIDLDGDGGISREEARSFGDMRFQRWDRDSDGAVTESEMVEAAQQRVAHRVGKMFARMDRNGDGRLERAELESAGQARFQRMDADGDGRVSFEEVRARWQARRHGESEADPEN